MKKLFHHCFSVREQAGKFCPTRFTARQINALEALNPAFGRIARCSAGVSVAFYTDAAEISFDYSYSPLYTPFGGFDIFENGVLCKNISLPESACTDRLTYTRVHTEEWSFGIFP